jgi:putative membrane protein
MTYRTAGIGTVALFGLLAAGAGLHANSASGSRVAAQTQNSDRDAAFVERAIETGQRILDTAKIATDRATVAEVRDFATLLVKDHTMSNGELRSLAQVPPDTPPAAAREAATAGLTAQVDLAFDRAYVAQAAEDHRTAVALYEQEAADGKDERLKLWAAQKLPALRDHLTTARGLEIKLASSALW